MIAICSALLHHVFLVLWFTDILLRFALPIVIYSALPWYVISIGMLHCVKLCVVLL